MKKRNTISNILRILAVIFATVIIIWALLPYFINSIKNTGTILSIVLGVLILLISIFWNQFISIVKTLWKKLGGKILIIATGILVFAMIAVFTTQSILMIYSANKTPAQNSTVIVLGASLYDGWRPSTMLRDRLKVAAEYLHKNPESVCIVSGGQGSDEKRSEADAMYEYLIENCNVSEDRIYKEDKSTSTLENLNFSLDVIKENNLNTDIVIATQEFHQYRAQAMAKDLGFNKVGPVKCKTMPYLIECYWVREFAAISWYWVASGI